MSANVTAHGDLIPPEEVESAILSACAHSMRKHGSIHTCVIYDAVMRPKRWVGREDMSWSERVKVDSDTLSGL